MNIQTSIVIFGRLTSTHSRISHLHNYIRRHFFVELFRDKEEDRKRYCATHEILDQAIYERGSGRGLKVSLSRVRKQLVQTASTKSYSTNVFNVGLTDITPQAAQFILRRKGISSRDRFVGENIEIIKLFFEDLNKYNR